MKAPEKLFPAQFARCFDHTFLKPAGDAGAVRRLCAEAREWGFASVCVNPCEVARAARLLKGSEVKVCTVVGFPLGQSHAETKAFEAVRALRDGARELDFVVNVRLLKAAAGGGKTALRALKEELALCAAVKDLPRAEGLPDPETATKLIIECCYLSDEEKTLACRLAREAGFDFVKTSTGFGPGGAVAEDVKLMRRTVGRRMGVKAAGGIRTLADALVMLRAGATRIGASASVSIMSEFVNLTLA